MGTSSKIAPHHNAAAHLTVRNYLRLSPDTRTD
jgi:hypothetical protein